jgi:hypothetical protein
MDFSRRAREVLRLMVENRDDEEGDGELVGEKGQWWIGDERTSGRVVNELIRACVIKQLDECSGRGYAVWVAHSDADRALADPEGYFREHHKLLVGEPSGEPRASSPSASLSDPEAPSRLDEQEPQGPIPAAETGPAYKNEN